MKVSDPVLMIPREKALHICNRSIRRMLDDYRQRPRPYWPRFIRKRLATRRMITASGDSHFTCEELGLAEPGWLPQQIGALSALIVKTNRFTHG